MTIKQERSWIKRRMAFSASVCLLLVATAVFLTMNANVPGACLDLLLFVPNACFVMMNVKQLGELK